MVFHNLYSLRAKGQNPLCGKPSAVVHSHTPRTDWSSPFRPRVWRQGKWALLLFLSSIPWLVICSPVMLPVSHGSNDLMPAKTCAFTHVQNSERGFSSPSSGIFLLMRYFQALKQSENFMPLWTAQLFQIYLSNVKADLKITRCIFLFVCFVVVVAAVVVFWSCYIIFLKRLLFSGKSIKSTWSCF